MSCSILCPIGEFSLVQLWQGMVFGNILHDIKIFFVVSLFVINSRLLCVLCDSKPFIIFNF